MSVFPFLECSLPRDYEEELPTLLYGLPTLGCELGRYIGETVELRVYLDPVYADAEASLRRALAAAGAEDIAVHGLEEKDWLEAYRGVTRPFSVGRTWWMDPHPDRPTPAPDGRIRLAVEPRMAFGTGSHETTQLVLMELEELPVRGGTVLDVGSGSGILSLAALALGARWAVGVEIDAQAVWVARQIAAQQELPLRPAFVVGEVAVLDSVRFDVVLCNMIADHFLPILPTLQQRLDGGGRAVLSGILDSQVEGVCTAAERCGFRVCGGRNLKEWASLLLERA